MDGKRDLITDAFINAIDQGDGCHTELLINFNKVNAAVARHVQYINVIDKESKKCVIMIKLKFNFHKIVFLSN